MPEILVLWKDLRKVLSVAIGVLEIFSRILGAKLKFEGLSRSLQQIWVDLVLA